MTEANSVNNNQYENFKLTPTKLFDFVLDIEGKHLITEEYGNGVIVEWHWGDKRQTKLWVYFVDDDGETYKLDGKKLVNSIIDIGSNRIHSSFFDE
jgi:hypothetical protein